MSTISIAEKKMAGNDGNKRRSDNMTTTELTKLCGVSRFTIINWTKQGRIKAIRTVGRHFRIPVSEALSLLRSFGGGGKASSSDSGGHCMQQMPTTNGDEECGNCLTGNEKRNKQIKANKKKVLYAFGYGVGRGIHALKGRSKVK